MVEDLKNSINEEMQQIIYPSSIRGVIYDYDSIWREMKKSKLWGYETTEVAPSKLSSISEPKEFTFYTDVACTQEHKIIRYGNSDEEIAEYHSICTKLRNFENNIYLKSDNICLILESECASPLTRRVEGPVENFKTLVFLSVVEFYGFLSLRFARARI